MTTKQGDGYRMIMGVLQAITCAALIWVATTIVETQVAVEGLRIEILNLKARTSNRYTAATAAADRRTQTAIDERQTQIIARIQAQLDILARDLREIKE